VSFHRRAAGLLLCRRSASNLRKRAGSMNRLKIIHVITGLATGGAEVMLLKLLSRMDRSAYEPVVLSLMDSSREPIWQEIERLEIPVQTLNLRPGLPNPAALWRLREKLREWKPGIVQGWEVHGNFAAYMAGWQPFFLNVRGSLDHPESQKLATRLFIRLLRRASSKAAAVIYNSRSSARQHEAMGYARAKTQIIPNGFDCDQFRPDEKARAEIRHNLRVPAEAFLIGQVARHHPVKDHKTSLQAFQILAQRVPDSYLLLAGRGMDTGNSEVWRMVERLSVTARVRLLGERKDVARLNAALDVAISSSTAEAFPNAVGEAMACGVPCVVTDVGDSAWIVGNSGVVVPPRSSGDMAKALESLCCLAREDRAALGHMARARVKQHFSIDDVVRQYEALYGESRAVARKAS